MTDQEATALNTTAKISKFGAIRTAASAAASGSNPYPIIYLSTTNCDGTPSNPYQARFGDTWRDEIIKSTALSPFVCITSLVEYVMVESARVMVDTEHTNNWYFYHDALSLMTASQTREWMKKTNIGGENCMQKWLVPMLGCNKDTPFEHRSVGNSPEFMPLDMSLNNDVKIGHNFHCAITSHLAQHDEKKFSTSTPKLISRGIHRLVEGHVPHEGTPSSERIIHDCNQALNDMRIVMEHTGAIVPGLVDRNGR